MLFGEKPLKENIHMLVVIDKPYLGIRIFDHHNHHHRGGKKRKGKEKREMPDEENSSHGISQARVLSPVLRGRTRGPTGKGTQKLKTQGIGFFVETQARNKIKMGQIHHMASWYTDYCL